MLVLTRRIGEQIVIAGDIRVTVCEIRGSSVRLGIAAPSSVAIFRQELVAALPEPAATQATGFSTSGPTRNEEGT